MNEITKESIAEIKQLMECLGQESELLAEDHFKKGQAIKVKDSVSGSGKKYAGRSGKIESIGKYSDGAEYYMVKFRSGGAVEFRPTELENQ